MKVVRFYRCLRKVEYIYFEVVILESGLFYIVFLVDVIVLCFLKEVMY